MLVSRGSGYVKRRRRANGGKNCATLISAPFGTRDIDSSNGLYVLPDPNTPQYFVMASTSVVESIRTFMTNVGTRQRHLIRAFVSAGVASWEKIGASAKQILGPST